MRRIAYICDPIRKHVPGPNGEESLFIELLLFHGGFHSDGVSVEAVKGECGETNTAVVGFSGVHYLNSRTIRKCGFSCPSGDFFVDAKEAEVLCQLCSPSVFRKPDHHIVFYECELARIAGGRNFYEAQLALGESSEIIKTLSSFFVTGNAINVLQLARLSDLLPGTPRTADVSVGIGDGYKNISPFTASVDLNKIEIHGLGYSQGVWMREDVAEHVIGRLEGCIDMYYIEWFAFPQD